MKNSRKNQSKMNTLISRVKNSKNLNHLTKNIWN